MQTETLLGLFLRLLPALAVFVLGLFAMGDAPSRMKWSNLLYQLGSIRPDQRDDLKIGRGVRWPFFLVAIGLLLWPLQYYRHTTRVIQTTGSDLLQSAPAAPRSDLQQSTSGSGSSSGNTSRRNRTPQSDLR